MQFALQSTPKWDEALPESSSERPCTPRKRLQLALEEDRKTGQKITRDSSIRDFSTNFVGSMLQSACKSPAPPSREN
ncbi:hypothetical protein PHYBOEH_011608 [Phytophthora boehmeriae]|uniref:Uncharacterized protein n=1 Tax=Phytophthora boehmeriae TaxID=109152 RepID=A0A8T1X8G9_9STRA|nr:hypothetical protein PHYBOEH_011608 [Phytophthora boehmeriae]